MFSNIFYQIHIKVHMHQLNLLYVFLQIIYYVLYLLSNRLVWIALFRTRWLGIPISQPLDRRPIVCSQHETWTGPGPACNCLHWTGYEKTMPSILQACYNRLNSCQMYYNGHKFLTCRYFFKVLQNWVNIEPTFHVQ